MSIEKNIERIADALEKMGDLLVDIIPIGLQKTEPKASKPPKQKPLEDIMPGEGEEAGTLVLASSMTSAELRELAQKYIQAAGDKTGPLVTFIRDQVCRKFSPADPKLVKIPDARIGDAAAMIEDWCKKNKITLPVEV